MRPEECSIESEAKYLVTDDQQKTEQRNERERDSEEEMSSKENLDSTYAFRSRAKVCLSVERESRMLEAKNEGAGKAGWQPKIQRKDCSDETSPRAGDDGQRNTDLVLC